MNETPEAIRERVKQEELAKGSDPRVAESRAKAAEARAKHGLPIDPQQAWKAKLEQEGGEGPPAAAAPAAPVESEAPAAERESPAIAAEAPAPAAQAEAPAPAPVAPAVTGPPAPVGAPQVVGIGRPSIELQDPEVGELIEAPEIETVYVGGGVSARTAGIPAWLIALMAAVIAWSLMYLVVFGTSNPVRETTGCIVKSDATFTCFNPKSAEEGGEAGH